MAQYGLIYRLQWNTVPSVMSASLTIPAQVMIVNIFDTETLIEDADTPVVIELLADANPLIIKIINNDEDKFSPIRAKQAIIQFKSDAAQFQDSLTFVDSPDNRWYVEITADGSYLFKGFLMPTDIQQDHLPDPNTVTLTASDHLALLRDIPLTTDAFENPSGKYRLANLIALCLKKTGLRLNLVAVNNLRPGSGAISPSEVIFGTFSLQPQIRVDDPFESFFYVGQLITVTGSASNNTNFHVIQVVHSGTDTHVYVSEAIPSGESALSATLTDANSGHIYDKTYLDALTFEKEIGASEDCNTVLEKILGEDCFLTQWKGDWYIMRVDEFDGNPIYECVFDVNGALVGFNSPTDYSKSLGANEHRRLANADALRRYDRPYGSIKEVAELSFPSEIPCNSDFARGTFIADLPDETNADGIIQQVEKHSIECWNFYSRQGGVANQIGFYGQPPIANSAAYVKKYFTNGDETNRKLVIETPTASGTGVPYVISQSMPFTVGDKIELSVELDYTNIGGTTGYVDTPIMVQLVSSSTGNIYWWIAYDVLNPTMPPRWQLTPATGSGSVIEDMYFGASVEDDSLNINLTSPPIPETGKVYVYLINFYANQITANYSNLSLTPIPLINGSYKRYSKFHNKVTRDPVGYFHAFRERQVYIFDSPKPLFKGSMFVYNGIDMILTSRWYTAAPFALGPPPGLDYLHPYGYIQAYSVWNQFNRGNRLLSSSELGLGSMWPDALDKWSITDTNPHVNNRYFMLISFEQNWKTALWSGVFIEDFRTDIDKDYASPHEFKYLTK